MIDIVYLLYVNDLKPIVWLQIWVPIRKFDIYYSYWWCHRSYFHIFTREYSRALFLQRVLNTPQTTTNVTNTHFIHKSPSIKTWMLNSPQIPRNCFYYLNVHSLCSHRRANDTHFLLCHFAFLIISIRGCPTNSQTHFLIVRELEQNLCRNG